MYYDILLEVALLTRQAEDRTNAKIAADCLAQAWEGLPETGSWCDFQASPCLTPQPGK